MNLKHERYATGAIFLATGLGVGAWAASISLVKERLQLSDALLGQALLAFSVGAIGAMLLAGRLTFRLRVWHLTLMAALVCAVLRVGPTLVSDYRGLVLLLFLIGAANGVTDVWMNSYATLVENAHSHPIMSSFHAMWSVGGLCGAAITGLLIQAGLGDTLSVGIPSLLSILLLLVASRANVSLVPPPVLATAKPAHQKANLTLLVLGGASFFCMLTEGAVADWSGVYMRQYAGVSAGVAASGYAVNAMAMALCRFGGDRLVKDWGPSRTLFIGCVVAAFGLFTLLAWPSLLSSLVGFALMGAGIANAIPVLFKAAALAGSSTAAGVAVAATTGYAGYLVGPFTLGLCSQFLGLRGALALLLPAIVVVGFIGSRSVARPRASGMALGTAL